jgi:uncharacterized protein (TIGR00266 family)
MFSDSPFKNAPAATPSETPGFAFAIRGHEMQFVEIELAPGMAAVAEAGAMMVKDAAITMETVFGDGSGQSSGLWGSIVSAGKRVLGGESLFTTVFTNEHPQALQHVAFAAATPGKIVPLRLSDYGGVIVCQKESFLASARGTTIGIQFQRKILTGLFGGDGFILQRLEGRDWVFIHAGGSVYERDLAPGEEIHVHPGAVAAFTGGIDFDVVSVGSIKSAFFGGQGFFFARLVGPGRIWLQSLPFSRLAAQISAAMPGAHSAAAGATGGVIGSGASSNWFGGSDGSSDSSDSSSDT